MIEMDINEIKKRRKRRQRSLVDVFCWILNVVFF